MCTLVLGPLHLHLGLVPLHLHLVLVPLQLHLVLVLVLVSLRFNLDPGPPLCFVTPPLASSAGSAPRTVFPGSPARVFVQPGATSTSSRPPHLRQPPSHLELFDLASMAWRSGGSHAEAPTENPKWQTGIHHPPPPPPSCGARDTSAHHLPLHLVKTAPDWTAFSAPSSQTAVYSKVFKYSC